MRMQHVEKLPGGDLGIAQKLAQFGLDLAGLVERRMGIQRFVEIDELRQAQTRVAVIRINGCQRNIQVVHLLRQLAGVQRTVAFTQLGPQLRHEGLDGCHFGQGIGGLRLGVNAADFDGDEPVAGEVVGGGDQLAAVAEAVDAIGRDFSQRVVQAQLDAEFVAGNQFAVIAAATGAEEGSRQGCTQNGFLHERVHP